MTSILLDVCDVRLDFETFLTFGPAFSTEVNGGECVDSFQVSAVITLA